MSRSSAGRTPCTGPVRLLLRTRDGGVDRDGPVQVIIDLEPGRQRDEDPLPGVLDGSHPK